jgi:hypothetical protein
MPEVRIGALSDQYFTVTREGHTRITPSIGGGTCIAHYAFWPARDLDPQNLDMRPADESGKHLTTNGTVRTSGNALEIFEDRRGRLVAAFNHVLRDLQDKGRNPKAGNAEQFQLVEPDDWDQTARTWEPVDPKAAPQERPKPRRVYLAETIGFSLWWPDGDQAAINSRLQTRTWTPAASDVRVRVQAEAHPDFFTLSFFIDPTTMWSDAQQPITLQPVHASTDSHISGVRRKRIFTEIETIRGICDPRIGSAAIERDLLPELPSDIDGGKARKLKLAADFLYKDIWDQFSKTFDFELEKLTDPKDATGRRIILSAPFAGRSSPDGPWNHNQPAFRAFGYFRGLVLPSMSDAGHPASISKENFAPLDEPIAHSGAGLKVFPRFFGDDTRGEEFKGQFTEPNAVVKAYWPFIRRVTPEADFRDYVACGVFDFRALYISSLGAQSEFDKFDDGDVLTDHNGDTVRSADIPSGHLPRAQRRAPPAGAAAGKQFVDQATGYRYSGAGRPASPIRYLFITKGEPHRRQIGRMVERINAIGTLRLFALKNLTIIREASTHMRIFGQELDAVTALRNQQIEELFQSNNKRAETLRTQIDATQQLLSQANTRLAELRIQRRYRRLSGFSLPAIVNDTEVIEPQLGTTLKSIEGKTHGTQRRKLERSIPRLELQLRRLETEQAQIDARLAAINSKADRRLLVLSSQLDDVGADAIGGLPYRLNRSRYYIANVRLLVESLRAGNIDTWVSYNQFVARGLEPSFKFIEDVYNRLISLRTRLQTAMQGIQTSAIVNQTEATRYNTYALEQIVGKVGQLVAATETIRKRNAVVEYLKNFILLTNAFALFAVTAYAGYIYVTTGAVLPRLKQLFQLLGLGPPG